MALRYRAAEGSERRRDAALEVMLWVGAILNDNDDVVVSVTGHQCGDPECESSQTVILLIRSDEPTQAIKIRKPLETITEADVAEALQPILAAMRTIAVG